MKRHRTTLLGAAGILAGIGTAVANANDVFIGYPRLYYCFYGASVLLIVVAIVGRIVGNRHERREN
jgi:hypothetical protein